MNNTGVTSLASITTAGTYATANITVDAQGRVTSASSGSGAGPGGATGVIQYNNGGSFGGLANFPANIKATLIRKSNVQDHETEFLLRKCRQSRRPRGTPDGFKMLRAQGKENIVSNGRFVFNQKHTKGSHAIT